MCRKTTILNNYNTYVLKVKLITGSKKRSCKLEITLNILAKTLS